MATNTKVWNPLLDLHTKAFAGTQRDKFGFRPLHGTCSTGDRQMRWNGIAEFAFAVPSPEALTVIQKHAPRLVEFGAGTGYWARLLSDSGVDVVALDKVRAGKENDYGRPGQVIGRYFPVRHGDLADLPKYTDRALFLCWPPYDTDLATQAVRRWAGDLLIYIGEGHGGCTADDGFFALLEDEFDDVEEVLIPQWDGIHDYMRVLRRKGTAPMTRRIDLEG